MSTSAIIEAALRRLTTRSGVVVGRASHTQNLRWANSALTTNGDSTSLDVSVIAAESSGDGFRTAVVSGRVDSPEQAALLADRVMSAAGSAPLAPGRALPEGRRDPEFDRDPDTVDPDDTERVVMAVGRMCGEPDPRFGYAELSTTTTYLATSAGTRQRHVEGTVRFEASARSPDGRRCAWWGTNDLDQDFDAAAEHLGQRLSVQEDRRDIDPGRHTVILTPSAVADLMIFLAWSADGRDAVEGHNVFSRPGGGTRIGETLSHRPITLFADPLRADLPTADTVVVESDSSAESVFDNGLRHVRTELIRDGRLNALRASRVTAERFGLSPCYLADNLVLTDDAGHGDLDALIARTADAVLITCLWYVREVDPQNLLLTGLTRDGVYRVRNGTITHALPNFRFNVSATDVLARIVDSSATFRCLPREWADWFTRAAMPAIVVEGFNLSSRSDAS